MNKQIALFFAIILLTSCSKAQQKTEQNIEVTIKDKTNPYQQSDNWIIDLHKESLLFHQNHTVVEYGKINDSIHFSILTTNDGVCSTDYLSTLKNRSIITTVELAQNCDHEQAIPTYNWSEYNKINNSIYHIKNRYRTTYASNTNQEYYIDEEIQYKYEITPDGQIIKNINNTSGLNLKFDDSYAITKNDMNQIRIKKHTKYTHFHHAEKKQIVLDSSMSIFTNQLLNRIIPHWYGTKWDFEGHTSIPNQGTIACGYFVSTTLLHMGMNVNRYKLAQQNPKNEALTLAIKKSNLLYVQNGKHIYTTLHSLDNGLYFVGLDSHVGYLYINNNNSFFIHSNYLDGKVMLEHTRQSEAFISSEYYITPITQNKELMHYWLTNKKLNIITE